MTVPEIIVEHFATVIKQCGYKVDIYCNHKTNWCVSAIIDGRMVNTYIEVECDNTCLTLYMTSFKHHTHIISLTEPEALDYIEQILQTQLHYSYVLKKIPGSRHASEYVVEK